MIFQQTKAKAKAIKAAKEKVPAYTKGKITETALSILNNEYGIEAWPQNNLAVRGRKFIGRKGVSDVLGYSRDNGRMCMCEVKTLNDSFKPEQKKLLTDLHNAGGFALVAYQEGIKIVVKPFVQTKFSNKEV